MRIYVNFEEKELHEVHGFSATLGIMGFSHIKCVIVLKQVLMSPKVLGPFRDVTIQFSISQYI
jgi:hypothetical protein